MRTIIAFLNSAVTLADETMARGDHPDVYAVVIGDTRTPSVHGLCNGDRALLAEALRVLAQTAEAGGSDDGES